MKAPNKTNESARRIAAMYAALGLKPKKNPLKKDIALLERLLGIPQANLHRVRHASRRLIALHHKKEVETVEDIIGVPHWSRPR